MFENDKLITFMEHHWVNIDEDNIITIGINEEALEDFDSISESKLPEENSEVQAEEACGELETDQGPLTLYSPVDGEILEINDIIVDDPSIIQDDCYGEGWLFRIQAEDESQVLALNPEDNSLGEDPDFADHDE